MADSAWMVYVLVSLRRSRTYVGITTDPDRRLEQHNGLRKGGARATRAARPWRIGVLHGPFVTRGEALRVERRLKRLRGVERLSPDASLRLQPATSLRRESPRV